MLWREAITLEWAEPLAVRVQHVTADGIRVQSLGDAAKKMAQERLKIERR
jgi:hypothetical protein